MTLNQIDTLIQTINRKYREIEGLMWNNSHDLNKVEFEMQNNLDLLIQEVNNLEDKYIKIYQLSRHKTLQDIYDYDVNDVEMRNGLETTRPCKCCNIHKSKSKNVLKSNRYRAQMAVEMLKNFPYMKVRLSIKWPENLDMETDLVTAYWLIYKIHADSLLHLISTAFKDFLKENIIVTRIDNGKIITEEIYWAIWSSCDVCRKHRKTVGYQPRIGYGHILQRFRGQRVLFADILFISQCKKSIKNLENTNMILVMASIKTSHITGKIIHGKIHANVVDQKDAKTVTDALIKFNDLPSVGLPDVIYSDRGSEFINKQLREYANNRNIQKIYTPTGSSQSNGLIERIVQMIRQALRVIAGDKGISMSEVHDYLDLAVERVNANYFIAKLGKQWKQSYWDHCPRITDLNEIADIMKGIQTTNEHDQDEWRINDIAYWKPPTLHKDDPAVKVRIRSKTSYGGTNAYVVEQIENEPQPGITSFSTIHIALKRDLAIIPENIKLLIRQTMENKYKIDKQIQTLKEGEDKGCQTGITMTDQIQRNAQVTQSTGTQTNYKQDKKLIQNVWLNDSGIEIEIDPRTEEMVSDEHEIKEDNPQVMKQENTDINTLKIRMKKLQDETEAFINDKDMPGNVRQHIWDHLENERIQLQNMWEEIIHKSNQIMEDQKKQDYIQREGHIIRIIKSRQRISNKNRAYTRRSKRKRKGKKSLAIMPTIWESGEEEETNNEETNTQGIDKDMKQQKRLQKRNEQIIQDYKMDIQGGYKLRRLIRKNIKTISEYQMSKYIVKNDIRIKIKYHRLNKQKQEVCNQRRTKRSFRIQQQTIIHRSNVKNNQYKFRHINETNQKDKKDIRGNDIQRGNMVIYGDKTSGGTRVFHIGKIVKIINFIKKIKYSGDVKDNNRMIQKQPLHIPVVIIHKYAQTEMNDINEIVTQNQHIHYRPQWAIKTENMGWKIITSKQSPNATARPVCEMRTIPHVMKIQEQDVDNLMKIHKITIKNKEAEFKLNMQYRKIKQTKDRDVYSFNKEGKISWRGRTKHGAVRKLNGQEILQLGLLQNIEIEEQEYFNLSNTQEDIQNDKGGQKDRIEEEIIRQTWDDMIYKATFQYMEPDQMSKDYLRKIMDMQEGNHTEIARVNNYNPQQNQRIKSKTLSRSKIKRMTSGDTSDNNIRKYIKGRMWKTYSKELHENIHDMEQDINQCHNKYIFEIDDEISTNIIQHYEIQKGKIRNVKDTLDEEQKLGVIGIDKKIVLTGLHPDDPLHMMVKKAKMKEWNSFKKQKVLTPITKQQMEEAKKKDPLAAPLPMRWVLEWKIIDGKKDIKARLVAQGTVRKDKRQGVLTEVALPNHKSLYTMLNWQVSQPNWNPKTSILQGDLKTAFLQAENRSEVVFVTRPKDDGAITTEDKQIIDSMFSADRLARAVMTLYGTRDAPANLDMAVRKSLYDRGYKETLSCPNLYKRFTPKGMKYGTFKNLPEEEKQKYMKKEMVLDSWVFAYVDDLLMGTGETTAMEVALELQQRWVFKEEPTPPSRFLGIFIKATEDGIFIDQELLAASLKRLISNYIWDKSETLQLPLLREFEAIEKLHIECLLVKGGKGILSSKKITKYKSLLGILSYLAHTRPDLLFTISFFGQFGAQPSSIALKHLQIACSYAARTSTYGIQFLVPHKRKEMGGDFSRIQQSKGDINRTKRDENNKPSAPKVRDSKPQEKMWNIEVFTDASYKQKGGRAHAGYMILLNQMIVTAKSTVQKRKAGSSTRAELLALAEAIDNSLAIKFLLLEMGISGEEITTTIWCDNDNTVTNVNSVNPHATEYQSTFMLRQLYRIIKQGAQIDTMRMLFPKLMDKIDTLLYEDDFHLIDYGNGTDGRYRTPNEMKEVIQNYKYKFGEIDSIIDKDYATYEIILERMNDSNIHVLHIDGENQLADGLTKMATSIDYVGRVVFDYNNFLLHRTTSIRDSDGKSILYRKEGHRERYKEDTEESDYTITTITDNPEVLRI